MKLPDDARLQIISIKLSVDPMLKCNAYEIEYGIVASTKEENKINGIKTIYAGVVTFPIEKLERFGVEVSEEDKAFISKAWDLTYLLKEFAEKLVSKTEELNYEITSEDAVDIKELKF